MQHATKRTISVAAGLVVLAGLVTSVPAQNASDPASTGQCVLLLKNGQVLLGEVRKSDDRYDVWVPGGRISIPTGSVDLCCRTLEEVYLSKRARLTLPAAQDHLELARWCQRQGLLRHAAEELAQAEAIEPSHPLIPLVRRGLELAERPPAVASPGSDVRQASFSTADLDCLVRQMPPGTVEQFARAVQPLLVNRCAAAACHGPGSNTQFTLLRPSPGRPPSRRLTERNLSAVMALVDREKADASQLLTVPDRPHGPLETPVFGDHESDQYKQLADWVMSVAQPDRSPNTATAAASIAAEKPSREAAAAVYAAPVPGGPALRQQVGPSWAKELEGLNLDLGDGTGPGQAAPGTLPMTADMPFPKPGLIDPLPPGQRAGVQRGAAVPQFVPKDPFDPAIFNRRFFGPDERD